MLVALVALLSGQTVAVLDVSAEDAVYEDESRALAIEAVDVMNSKGLTARRVDESELPKRGCRSGPCLEKVAKGSDVLVTVDVVELDKGKWGVATTALAGRTGLPLAGGRYQVDAKTKRPPKELEKFVQKLVEAVTPKPKK
jgi:acetamidase/formamidase